MVSLSRLSSDEIILEIASLVIGIIPIGFFNDVHYALTSTGFAGFIHKINVFSLILNSISTGDIVSVVKNMIA